MPRASRQNGSIVRHLLILIALALPAAASEIQIQHAVIQKALTQMVFTDEGRKYVKGSRTTKCSFAYLEHPEISSEAGQLKIRARFTGKSATDVFGNCLGFGGSFHMVIRATPFFKDGHVRLRAVKIQPEDQNGFYARRVSTTMAASLERDVKVDVETEAKRLLSEAPPGAIYRQELRSFRVTDVRVTDDALVLVVDLALVVKQ
jgi:hypothetical protein